ncbi:hypothetical protein [Streptomyces sp. NPDC048106]|uniref:hypothetical protein n=1 Tax=Streptomyces sp. NPDC048106 TaxID=3155750 RepID=UPI003452E7BD
MSTEQHGADAYGREPARISHHQHEATAARFTVFQALAAVGIGHEQADDIVAKREARAVAGTHTRIPESRGSKTAGTPESATSPATCCASPTPPPRGGSSPRPAPCWSPTPSSPPPPPPPRRRLR